MKTKHEIKQLEQVLKKVIIKAKEFGLDFYDTYFEISTAQILYTPVLPTGPSAKPIIK